MRNHQHSWAAFITALLLAFSTPQIVIAGDPPTTEPPVNPRPHSSASAIDSKLPRGVDTNTGFRMNRYRGPVPETNPGTEVVSTSRAFQLFNTGQVVFIDVFPPRGLGADPIDGHWITNESHQNIAGSTWLPEVGRGHLEQEHIDYFERNLTLLTNNDMQTPLLFYCTADCWQSWNAARRALQWGYENIFWYPDGTDGWLEQGHPLVVAEPVNFFGEDY